MLKNSFCETHRRPAIERAKSETPHVKFTRAEKLVLTWLEVTAYSSVMLDDKAKRRRREVESVSTRAKLAQEKAGEALVKRLKVWRKKNGLSQRQAAEVMEARGVLVDVMTTKQWEQGRNRPGRLAGKLVGDFLERYPVITDAPVHGKRSKLSAEDLAEIRRLREEGETMKAIGQRFGVGESYISRIVSGERLAKVTK